MLRTTGEYQKLVSFSRNASLLVGSAAYDISLLLPQHFWDVAYIMQFHDDAALCMHKKDGLKVES